MQETAFFVGYIPCVVIGNCHFLNSARRGVQRLNEKIPTSKTRKTAFPIAPVGFAVRLGFFGRNARLLVSFFRVRRGWNFASMIANSVRLTEVLRQMEEGEERFSIRFVTADRRRKTGGKVEVWHDCQLSRRRREVGQRPAPAPATDSPSRMPSHYENATRNIVQRDSSQVRKIHIWLMLEFNGQTVVLG